MRSVILLLLFFPSLASAGVDKPWNEPSDGYAPMPGVAVLSGLVGAGFMAYQGLKSGDSIGSVFVAALLGFAIGAMIGLPISCIAK